MTRTEELLRARDARRMAYLNECIAAEKAFNELAPKQCMRCMNPYQPNSRNQRHCRPCAVELNLMRGAAKRRTKVATP